MILFESKSTGNLHVLDNHRETLLNVLTLCGFCNRFGTVVTGSAREGRRVSVRPDVSVPCVGLAGSRRRRRRKVGEAGTAGPGSGDVSDGSAPLGPAHHRGIIAGQLLFYVHERRETKGGDGGVRAESARRRSDARRHLASRAATTRAYSFRLRTIELTPKTSALIDPRFRGLRKHCH